MPFRDQYQAPHAPHSHRGARNLFCAQGWNGDFAWI